MKFKVGDRVRFSSKVTAAQFGASPEEWAANPKTGTVIEHTWDTSRGLLKDSVFVKMDKEWTYNERDLVCWLQGDFEIMDEDELEAI